MHHPTDWTAHTTAFVIPVVVVCLEQEIAQWIHHGGSIHWAISRFIELHLALHCWQCVLLYTLLKTRCAPWVHHGGAIQQPMELHLALQCWQCVIVYVIKNPMCSMGPPWRSDSTTHGATSPLQCWQCVLLFTLLKTWCAPWVHHGGAIQQPMELHLALQCWQCVLLFTLLKTWCAPWVHHGGAIQQPMELHLLCNADSVCYCLRY